MTTIDGNTVLYFTEMLDYLCTANEDGSIPLGALVVGRLDLKDERNEGRGANPLRMEMLRRANLYNELQAEIDRLRDVLAALDADQRLRREVDS